ncbi:ATP-NAD kinase family protein [Idiomarina xiamenensis]|uniref:ATP-NAD/AcoX kinase n=1 Tax=Idiomarina xiamenensis 10-D-4 TaxID=740709 RepID=K2KDT7_9GAMM|nr:ATP-NAD kinase family protein [Idiomarina xiamenensis]EKE84902.1 hypothetical protein A10D4_04800 [Idiomarina xiamenensis 10-D-4]
MSEKLVIGLAINPWAGVGGSVALKGSDGATTAQQAIALGAEQRANARVDVSLALLTDYRDKLHWLTAAGDMGEQALLRAGMQAEVVYHSNPAGTEQVTSAADTQAAVKAMLAKGVDLLVFAGGDGTARDICQCVPEQQPVLGIPAGVKIHSGVYAISPTAAGRVIEKLVIGELASLQLADVMDIDEELFRQGQVRARRYGEMLVPAELQYIQAVKMGGKESDELVLADIAADIIESMEDDALYVMGSGSTVAAIMEEMGLPNTLLGVDVVRNEKLLAADVTAAQLQKLLAEHDKRYLVITLIGGQGHLFGRGNQQLSPAVIRCIGKAQIRVVATKTKLNDLQGRPLQVDTGDVALDRELNGLISVTTGYHDQVLVRVAAVD